MIGEKVYLTFYAYDPDVHVEEQRSQCLWSDGVSFWVGWWSRDNRKLYITNADGTNGPMDDDRIRWWAKLPNLHMVMHTHGAADAILANLLGRGGSTEGSNA